MQSPLPFTTYIPSSEKTPALAPTEVPTPVESKKKKKDYVEISRFMQAAEEGDTTLLSNLIEEAIVKGQLKSLSAVGDLRDDDHMNVLDHASACGQVEVMRELILTYGVDVNGADDVNGLTPLHHASRAGQMQAVTFLVLVASADVNHVSLSGLTPSEITTFRRIKDFFEKQKPSGGNSIGSADRFSVPSRQDADAVQDGSDLSVSSSSTSQPVSPAPEWKNRVQGALRRSSVARGTTSTPSSSSNISASASSLPDSTLRNSFRSSQISSLPTSLHSNTATLTLKTNSTSSDERFTQSILLKNFKQSSLKGAPDSVASVFDPSRIFQSVREGDMTRVSNLIEEAIVKGQLKSLSAVGDLRDDDHMNVLDHASACGQVEVIRELILTYGVDVNGADDVNGLTPLHHASRAGQMQAVTFLVLVASADVNHVSLSGLTPSEITSSKRIQKFLLGQKSAGGKGSSAAGSGVGTTGSGSSRNSRGRLQLSSEFHRLESSESLN
jgi:ankyrin repeat protein